MRRWILFFVFAAALAGAVFWMQPAKPALPSSAFDIYFTCDTSGRLEPCGCFTGQFGGLTRVSTVLKNTPANALKVEIGNAIAGTKDYEIHQYRYLLRAYAEMGYSAVNLGKREAQLPVAVLRDLIKTSPLPLLSANLLDVATGGPLAKPYCIVKSGALRVALIGVLDPARISGEVDANVRVTDMLESLRVVIPQAKKEADVLVCLAFTNEDGLARIAKEFYEIYIVLGGDVPQPSPSLTQINQSYIIATTNQSKALGEVHAHFDAGMRRLREVRGDITLMKDNIPQDDVLIALSRTYRKEIRGMPLAVDRSSIDSPDAVPGVASPATYLGNASCAGCHPKAVAIWEKTGHAHAFASLRAKDSDADPGCISCHATGFAEHSGYTRSMNGGQLSNVNCESCHGPASVHVKVRTDSLANKQPVLFKMRAVGAGSCVQCHHGEFSRPFKWEEFWPLVQHGKE